MTAFTKKLVQITQNLPVIPPGRETLLFFGKTLQLFHAEQLQNVEKVSLKETLPDCCTIECMNLNEI